VADNGHFAWVEVTQLVLKDIRPGGELRSIGGGHRRIAHVAPVVDQGRREQELPVLRRPVVLKTVQDQESDCHKR
jgi:hypothetical protein